MILDEAHTTRDAIFINTDAGISYWMNAKTRATKHASVYSLTLHPACCLKLDRFSMSGYGQTVTQNNYLTRPLRLADVILARLTSQP
jgi:hypothetical protein